MAEKKSLQHLVQRITHAPCRGAVVCVVASSYPMGTDRGALGCDLCQPHTLYGRSISSRSTLAGLARYLSVGCAAWTFMGHLEACRAWFRVDRARGRIGIHCDRFAAHFECLDQLVACSCPIVGILRSRADSPHTETIHHHPGLAAILPTCLPADSGFALYSVS